MQAAAAIREAAAQDVARLVQLARAFYDEDGFTTGDTALHEHFTLLVPDPSAHVVVVLTEGEICGFALTTTGFTLESGRIAELQDLYVRPEDRRRGLGSALVADAVGWARGMAASSIEVVVAPNGRDVRHLHRYYAARGFVDEGRRILGLPL